MTTTKGWQDHNISSHFVTVSYAGYDTKISQLLLINGLP